MPELPESMRPVSIEQQINQHGEGVIKLIANVDDPAERARLVRMWTVMAFSLAEAFWGYKEGESRAKRMDAAVAYNTSWCEKHRLKVLHARRSGGEKGEN